MNSCAAAKLCPNSTKSSALLMYFCSLCTVLVSCPKISGSFSFQKFFLKPQPHKLSITPSRNGFIQLCLIRHAHIVLGHAHPVIILFRIQVEAFGLYSISILCLRVKEIIFLNVSVTAYMCTLFIFVSSILGEKLLPFFIL